MNKKPYLVIIYQLCFALLSMVIIWITEGYGTEMFAYAFYFNIIYLVVGGIVNYLSYLGLHRSWSENVIKLVSLHFLSCLVLMNLFSYFFNTTWITWSFISGLFGEKSDTFWVALAVHALMIVSYFLSFIISRNMMQKGVKIST
jgi:hypothetical protein